MARLDWIVIVFYFAGIVAVAFVLGRRQKNQYDYYLAGRSTRWWHSGFSTMATQLGAISFVSAPAFVAMKDGGGMKWLAYEFGVPIGVLIAVIFIMPNLHRGGYISIYGYLERRFDRRTRNLVSLLFQIGRGLATAVSVLAGGLIISTALPLSTAQAIILIGAITILYDAAGGIKAVILSDVVQMCIILIGILVCGLSAYRLVGWSGAWQSLSADRLDVLNFKQWGFTTGESYGFWPMAVGGIFLYASYYGCDQSQVQRELSVGTLSGVRKSLLFNAFGRFPVVLLYCIMGVMIGAVFAIPGYMSEVASAMGTDTAAVAARLQQDPDRMVPMFILTFLPPGLIGLVLVAIVSALMSSLDSAINSLSAVTVQDFYKVYIRPEASEKHYLAVSKLFTLLWGAFCIAAALAFASVGEATRQTTIVLINAVGSLLYGPILAAFIIGVAAKRVRASDMIVGVLTGIAANLVLWRLTDVSWLWWNLAGFIASAGASLILSLRTAVGPVRGTFPLTPEGGYERLKIRWRLSYTLVVIYFFVIIAVASLIERIA
jgi:SSS family solute:Na+ symporter